MYTNKADNFDALDAVMWVKLADKAMLCKHVVNDGLWCGGSIERSFDLQIWTDMSTGRNGGQICPSLTISNDL